MPEPPTAHDRFVAAFAEAFGEQAAAIARCQMVGAAPEVLRAWHRILADLERNRP